MKRLMLILFILFTNFAHAQQTADTVNKFIAVTINATFAGPGTFFDFIARNIRYPTNAVINHTEGKVLVQFVVERNGQVGDAIIVRHVSADLDTEALRVVRLSKWYAGIQNGTKMKVMFTVPFTFKLPAIAGNANISAKKDTALDDQLNQATQTSQPTARIDTNLIFVAVELQPTYPGGKSSFKDYTAKSLKVMHNTYNGIIIIMFVVEIDGSLSNFKILRGTNDTANAMAISIMKNSPKWNPGIQNGRMVRCWFTLPIKFESE